MGFLSTKYGGYVDITTEFEHVVLFFFLFGCVTEILRYGSLVPECIFNFNLLLFFQSILTFETYCFWQKILNFSVIEVRTSDHLLRINNSCTNYHSQSRGVTNLIPKACDRLDAKVSVLVSLIFPSWNTPKQKFNEVKDGPY